MGSLLVSKRGERKERQWPKDFMSHRGTTMPKEAVDFFTVGKLYRVPMFLATSFHKETALDFLKQKSDDHVAVHFIFKLDKQKQCDHALYIEEMTLVAHEDELLYMPYSAFTVISINWPSSSGRGGIQPGYDWESPIVISS